MKQINIAILGFGIVGKGTFEILTAKKEELRSNFELDIRIKKVLVRDKAKAVRRGLPQALAALSINEILNDEKIETVVELIGGSDAAKDYVISALKKGKKVVTANKELLTKHWELLMKTAAENNTSIYYEAACAGAVPIIRAITQSLQADEITQITGIINGTTNYILSNMERNGCDLAESLKGAQSLGYAEADPASDLCGYDAAYKLSILCTLAFKTYIPFNDIFCEGIDAITKDDIESAHELGYSIKLLAIAKKNKDAIEARVHPCFISKNHALAATNGAFNSVYVTSKYAGELMFYGQGAGAYPTGSAVVSDIVFCALHDKPSNKPIFEVSRKNYNNDFESKYYIRISVANEVGMLSKVAGIFAKNNVSISKVTQLHEGEMCNPVIFITHNAKESCVNALVKELKKYEKISSIDSLIRIF